MIYAPILDTTAEIRRICFNTDIVLLTNNYPGSSPSADDNPGASSHGAAHLRQRDRLDGLGELDFVDGLHHSYVLVEARVVVVGVRRHGRDGDDCSVAAERAACAQDHR